MVKMFREDRDHRNLRTKTWHKNNRERSYLAAAKKRARMCDLPFSLTIEDIVFPDICPVLGIPLFFSERRTDNTPSLDKKVPEQGYVQGNIRIISWRANRLKNDATLEELERLVEYLKSS